MSQFSIAIHGGAGTILKTMLTKELESAYRQGLEQALEAGFSVLHQGGTSLDAVTAATIVLEDNILFNAGKGSVFTKAGTYEMDASVMDGRQETAGAVCGVGSVRNPILLARAVMEQTDHVLLSGTGAMELAREHHLAVEPDSYFYSPYRYEQWRQVRETDAFILDHSVRPEAAMPEGKKFGTVGAVACDKWGNLAAATSTGGMTNKRPGRIGDSPLIGCGTYASNRTCAISCTGHGELFIRTVAAYDVHARMIYGGMSLEDSMRTAVMQRLKDAGAEGGMIGVDNQGRVSMHFNSEGMYRGFKCSDGTALTAIYAS